MISLVSHAADTSPLSAPSVDAALAPPWAAAARSAEGGATTPTKPFFGYVLMQLGRQWRKLLHQRLAQMGLTDASWVPLFHLHQVGDGISLKALAQRMGLESSTLVRVVDLLEDRALVRREADAQDRRSKRLCITDAGRQAVEDVLNKLQLAEADLLQGMEPEQVQALHQGMLLLSQRLDETLAQTDAGSAGDVSSAQWTGRTA